jgi:hypothetical protein
MPESADLQTRRQALQDLLAAVTVQAAAAIAQGALEDAAGERARSVELERALLRAHIRHGGACSLSMLTGARRGLWCAWNGQSAIGLGMLALRPRARWARIVAMGAVLPGIGAECAAVVSSDEIRHIPRLT